MNGKVSKQLKAIALDIAKKSKNKEFSIEQVTKFYYKRLKKSYSNKQIKFQKI